MKIKFLEAFHEVDGIVPKVGDVLDIAEELAAPLIAKRVAEPVETQAKTGKE